MRLLASSYRWIASKRIDRKSTRLNSSHSQISYAVFCLKKKNKPRYDLHASLERENIYLLHHSRAPPRAIQASDILKHTTHFVVERVHLARHSVLPNLHM